MKNRNTAKQTWSHGRAGVCRSIHQSPLSSGPLKKKRKTQNRCFQRETEKEKNVEYLRQQYYRHGAATSANSRITKMYFTHEHHTQYIRWTRKTKKTNETGKLEYIRIRSNGKFFSFCLSHSLSLRARFVGRIFERRKKNYLLPQSVFSALVLQQAANSAIASATLSYRRTACTKEANECVYHLFLWRVFNSPSSRLLFSTETNALPLHTSGPAASVCAHHCVLPVSVALFICIASSSQKFTLTPRPTRPLEKPQKLLFYFSILWATQECPTEAEHSSIQKWLRCTRLHPLSPMSEVRWYAAHEFRLSPGADTPRARRLLFIYVVRELGIHQEIKLQNTFKCMMMVPRSRLTTVAKTVCSENACDNCMTGILRNTSSASQKKTAKRMNGELGTYNNMIIIIVIMSEFKR